MSESSISCKICSGHQLEVFAHTARCLDCGVLLFFPYPNIPEKAVPASSGTQWVLNWYLNHGWRGHLNFTNIFRFVVDEQVRFNPVKILDYGGSSGQFALVVKSHLPLARVFLTDIQDDSTLAQYRAMNEVIPFDDFPSHSEKFDYIFLNDVFEHVSDPIALLKLLKSKLKEGGKLFIDTPRQFWIYPVIRHLSNKLYTKVLRGTVSRAHLQIWTKKSFLIAIESAKFKVTKLEICSEFTVDAAKYLKQMEIKNSILRWLGLMAVRNSFIFRFNNKIMAILEAN